MICLVLKASELKRFESEQILRKFGLPNIARRIVLKRGRGKFALYPAKEDIFVLDENKGVIYTNYDAVYDKECYPVENGATVCFPKKPVPTDPKTVRKKPLKRNEFEEAIISVEDAVDDNTMYGHFAYYCRTRGGHPILVNTDEGMGMVCVGGEIDGYGVVSETVADPSTTLAAHLPDGGRALTLYYLGKEYSDAMDKTEVIIPADQYRKFGIRAHIV